MKYRFSGYVEGSCGWNPPFYAADNFCEIEKAIMNCPQICAGQFMVSWPLLFSVFAFVSKYKGYPDIIVLKKGEVEVNIIRRTDLYNVPVAAFCFEGNDDFADIPTEILNIAFRSAGDPFVNKGLVWTWLDLREASVVFMPVILQCEGLIEKIVHEAESAIKKEIFDLFDSVEDFQVAEAQPLCF